MRQLPPGMHPGMQQGPPGPGGPQPERPGTYL
jgi:hypothetical protein